MNEDSPRRAVDPRRIDRLPKVSLHRHFEGSLRAETVIAIARRRGVPLSTDDPAALYRFDGFLAFLRSFREVCTALAEPADYGRAAREVCADLRAENVRYAELFVSPAGWRRLHPGLDLRAAGEAVAAACAAAEAAGGPRVALIVDLTRNFGPEEARRTVDLARAWRDLGVIGVGLGGDEAGFPGPLFVEAFRLADRAGLRLTAHAGEAAGPESVRRTVETLGVERVGHGVRAAESPGLLAWLAARGVGMEQAPTSNVLTRAVASLARHPMAACVAAGVRVAVDADDPTMFGATIGSEMRGVARRHGAAFLSDRLRDAIAMSFAPEDRRAALRRELDAALAAEAGSTVATAEPTAAARA